jgi:hypothetical protein
MIFMLCGDSNRPDGRSIRLSAVTRSHRLSPVEYSHVGSGRVVGLDADTLQFVDAFGADVSNGTHDLDLDLAESGRSYVADTHNGRAAIFAMRGTQGEGVFHTPEGVESEGDILWLSDSGNDRIVKYRIVR